MQRVHPLVRLAALGVLVGAAFAALALTGPLSAARVRGWIGGGRGLDVALLFVIVSASLTVACFPGPVLAAASGVLFGTAEGTCVSIVAAELGAVLAFAIARTLAGDVVARVGGPRLRAISAWVGRRGFLSVLYARIAPGVPYTVVNYAAGLSPVALAPFAAATLLGMAPRAFAYTALGGSLGNLTSPEAIIAVAVLLVMAFLGLGLAWRERRAARASGSGGGSLFPAGRSVGPP
jgi:uncharacterized membrane protein YdjX (TVP38/TMEM64 family)